MGAAASPHPTDRVLQSFGLGKLDDQSAESVSEHLDSCPDCQRRVAEMSSDTFLGKLQNAQGRPNQAAGGLSQLGVSTAGQGPAVGMSPAAETLPPGLADHPDYEIKRELGRGGMGVVYLAHNTLMGRDEVLKVMGRHIVERPGVFDRFVREIRSVARLRHPNIVAAYHAARLGESIMFAMEYVEGLDLSRMVKAKGPLPVGNACNFIHQAALGLQHAHEEGLVHRDIKPANLMLTRKGDKAMIKVLDFGLAKATREEKVDNALTSEGQALGTPDYIAPEQILNAPSADIRADIYSLGGTLYYLLTGRPPFQATSLYDMYQAHISCDAHPLNIVRPEVPVELAALVAKMMAKEPERRFQTPGAVAQALTPFFKKGNIAFKGPSDSMPRSRHAATAQPGSKAGSELTKPAPARDDVAALAEGASAPTVRELRWESLIEVRGQEPLVTAVKANPPAPEPTPAEARHRGRRLIWMVLLAASVLGAVTLGVIIYVATDYGRIKIVVEGPQPTLVIDGATVRIEGLDAPVTLTAGEHEFTVRWRDSQFKTEKFIIRRGENETLRVEYEPRAVETAEGPSGARRGNATPQPVAFPKTITNSISMKLALIPAGEFKMGSTPEQIDKVLALFPGFKQEWASAEQPQHRVRVSRPFYLGAHEVTRGQFAEFVRAANYRTEAERDDEGGSGFDVDSGRHETGKKYSWRDTGFPQSDEHPVVNVSWNDAVAFCDWLSRIEGRTYRLPTEAEWEYACRAGTTTLFSTGDEPEGVVTVANLAGAGDGFPFTAPVGSFKANAFGVFDMHGNVWEMCADWFDPNYYSYSPATDPKGPLLGSSRISRGQTWDGGGPDARSAHRDCIAPTIRGASTGFRVALTIPGG